MRVFSSRIRSADQPLATSVQTSHKKSAHKQIIIFILSRLPNENPRRDEYGFLRHSDDKLDFPLAFFFRDSTLVATLLLSSSRRDGAKPVEWEKDESQLFFPPTCCHSPDSIGIGWRYPSSGFIVLAHACQILPNGSPHTAYTHTLTQWVS